MIGPSFSLTFWQVALLCMWGYLPMMALAQSASTSLPLATTAATTTAVVYTGVPSIVMNTLPTVTACGSARVNWQLFNEDPAKFHVTIQAINIGVDQTIPFASVTSSKPLTTATPLTSTSIATSTPILSTAPRITTSTTLPIAASSLAARALAPRYSKPLNVTLGSGSAATGLSVKVSLPAGRYYLLGTVDDTRGSQGTSSPFTVLEGSDVSCLGAYGVVGSVSASAKSTSGSTKPSSTVGSGAAASSGAPGSSSSSGGIGTGAIGGIVVGVLAVLAIVGAILFICLRRRRRNHNNETGVLPEMRRSIHGGSSALLDRFTPVRSSSHARLPSGREPIALNTIGESSQGSHELGNGREKGGYTSPDDSLPATPIVLAGGGGRNGVGNPFETPRLENAGHVQQAGEMGDFGILAGGGGSGSGSGSGNGSGSGTPTTPGLQRDRSQSGSQSAVLGRSTSTRRKPVPSLGAELRNQMGLERDGKEVMLGEGNGNLTPPELSGKRGSYSIMPDPPLAPR